jgi:pyridoxal/pyridoxine/pyridoxamine kinase
MKVTDEESCIKAVEKLHKLGPSIVVVTSGIWAETGLPDSSLFYCYGSKATPSSTDEKNGGFEFERYRFEVPFIGSKDVVFTGTGDVFAALLV